MMPKKTKCKPLKKTGSKIQCRPPKPIKPNRYFRKNTWKDIVVRESDYNEGVVVIITPNSEVKAINIETAQYFIEHPENFYELDFNQKILKDE
jgi:hypothetical protein